MVTSFKFLSGFDNVDIKQFFERGRIPSTSGRNRKQSKRRVGGDIRKYFYSNGAMDEWNKFGNGYDEQRNSKD